MKELSRIASEVRASTTLAVDSLAKQMRADGLDVIGFGTGEPDFDTPDNIKEAGIAAIREGKTKYTPAAGLLDLRKAAATRLKLDFNLDYDFSQIVVASGAKHNVYVALMALLNPGDEVIIPAPYWVSYPQMVLLAEGTPVAVPTTIEQDFKMTPEQLEQAITPRTRAIILCSPSNPTGSVYSAAELEALKDVLLKHERVMIIADEIYEHINYVGAHASMAQFPDIKDRVVIVNGVSKAYAMTGWRIGFIAAPEWVVKGCNKLQGQYTSGPCSVSQKAAEAAAAEAPAEDAAEQA